MDQRKTKQKETYRLNPDWWAACKFKNHTLLSLFKEYNDKRKFFIAWLRTIFLHALARSNLGQKMVYCRSAKALTLFSIFKSRLKVNRKTLFFLCDLAYTCPKWNKIESVLINYSSFLIFKKWRTDWIQISERRANLRIIFN